jgi:hypothetical protein
MVPLYSPELIVARLFCAEFDDNEVRPSSLAPFVRVSMLVVVVLLDVH